MNGDQTPACSPLTKPWDPVWGLLYLAERAQGVHLSNHIPLGLNEACGGIYS